jgi:hypothetical protein
MMAASRVSRKRMKKIGTEKRFLAMVDKNSQQGQDYAYHVYILHYEEG